LGQGLEKGDEAPVKTTKRGSWARAWKRGEELQSKPRSGGPGPGPGKGGGGESSHVRLGAGGGDTGIGEAIAVVSSRVISRIGRPQAPKHCEWARLNAGWSLPCLATKAP
jgi:hypothetical protein